MHCSLAVRGKTREWIFSPIKAKPEHVKEWQEDGLDVVVLENTVPQMVQMLGLTGLWCWLQDAGMVGW